ncbi:MAG: hypothetical protein K8953_06210, partial [Proteobacteria bacterium]|nr:hypothetical protein [Pseudomonadota bacterium]
APPPVFAVAPPQERSFSQSQPEPQTSTETVMKKIDTTASQTVARTEDIVFTDWTGSFTSPALPATATFTGNGFLSGAIDFDATGADRILNSGRLNLATATFYGDAIGGDADDGVAFFRAEKNGQTHNYAGLSSDTDLGAPLVEEADKTATWNGHFRSVGYLALDTDFTLTVDFSAARTLTATTTNIINNHFFTLTDATYDENGVIIGGITITNGADSGDGVLTGLIGQDGAVGAFYSNARGAKGYVGGFVASPTLANNPDINFADWALSFTNPALATTADFTDNGFLAGAAVELEHTDASSIFMNADKIINAGRLNLSTTTFDGNAIGEDADDGVIFFRAEKDSQTYNYAGVLTGTNLGAPLVVEAAKTAEWTGHFYALVGDVAIDTDFTLTVDFSTARTLEARTYGKSNNYFTLENATYNENGVISGMVRNTRGANTADGVLTGLIGDDGAVGAFYSNDRGANSYAGGFVASKTVKTYNTDVTASDWTRSFSKVPPNQVTSSTRRNEFLSGGLLGGRLDETGAGTIMHRGSLNLATATYDGVRLGGDAGDGMSFFRANNNGTVYNYAGLYSSTDLGAPLGDTFRGETTANWGGRIRTAGWFNFDTDFILKVNFGTRKLNVDRLRNPADTDQWLEITEASYTT